MGTLRESAMSSQSEGSKAESWDWKAEAGRMVSIRSELRRNAASYPRAGSKAVRMVSGFWLTSWTFSWK